MHFESFIEQKGPEQECEFNPLILGHQSESSLGGSDQKGFGLADRHSSQLASLLGILADRWRIDVLSNSYTWSLQNKVEAMISSVKKTALLHMAILWIIKSL